MKIFNKWTLHSEAQLWAQWVMAGIISWVISIIPVYIVDTFLMNSFRVSYDIRDFIALAVIGFNLGVAQWLVLRQYFPQSASWILATCIGIAVGWNSTFVNVAVTIASMNGIYTYDASNVGFHFNFGILSGSILGVMQWLIVRRKFRQANLWILANALSEGLASALYHKWFTGALGSLQGGLLTYLGIYKGIAMTITGASLIYLLNSSSSEIRQIH